MLASKDNFLPKVFGLKLNDRSVSVRLAPAISYFEDMNIPGADLCAVNHVRAIVDYKLKWFSRTINRNNDRRVIRSH